MTQVVVRTLGSVQGSGTLSRGEGRFLGDPRSLQWGSPVRELRGCLGRWSLGVG